MASANDSQGLKIAVAIFVSLTVILAVTAYFLYSEYSKASEQLTAARSEASSAKQETTKANTSLLELRTRAGYSNLNDPLAIQQAIETDQNALLESLGTELGKAVEAVNQAQQQGATGPEAVRYRDNLTGLVQTFNDESTQNPTLKGSLATLAAMTANQAGLTTALATDNVRLRRQLENTNTVNQAELTKQQQAAQQSQTDLAGEHTKYEGLFNEQRIRVDDLQTQLADLRSKNDDLGRQLAAQQSDSEDRISDLLAQMKVWRDRTEKDEVVLDTADGLITSVDYRSGQVRTNITRSMGGRPQLLLSIFDADAPGLPSDRPKARIKLLQVDANGSVASIEEQFEKNNPLRPGDQVYSAAWSPNEPQRFALVGKIDMNRDGYDDRDDLKRLIAAAGGVVDYDLPPPLVGQEQGELNARITSYIIDEREPIRTPSNARAVQSLDLAEEAFAQARTQVIEQARQLGIRPLPVERLLSSLGYSYGMMIPGNVDAADRDAIRNLLNPGGVTAPAPGSEEFEQNRQEAEEAPAPF